MTPQAAAQWMLDELAKRKVLNQERVSYYLHQQDDTLTYQNDNGNLAISKDVLKEFNKLIAGDVVVWSRSERAWRYRKQYDKLGRMQD